MEKRLGAPPDLYLSYSSESRRSRCLERGYTHEYRSTNAEDVF